MSTWRAGCGESRTSGSEGGPEKPIVRKARRRSGPTLHLCKDVDGVSVRGGGAGCLESPGGGLIDGRPPAHRTGPGCAEHGHLAATPARRGPPQRPRIAVHFDRVRAAVQGGGGSMSTAGSAIQGAQHGHSAPILDLRADLHPNEPHSGPPRLLRTAGVPGTTPWIRPPCRAAAAALTDRSSLADSVELPVGAPRASGLAHGLTGQHSLDLPAPSGGLFALRRRYEPQGLPVHQDGTTPVHGGHDPRPAGGRVLHALLHRVRSTHGTPPAPAMDERSRAGSARCGISRPMGGSMDGLPALHHRALCQGRLATGTGPPRRRG